MNWPELTRHPMFGVTTTLLAYALALGVRARLRWMHPLLITCGSLIALLVFLHIPYGDYRVGGDMISFFLGPATIALGVPFYKQASRIGRRLPAACAALLAGAIAGIASAAFFVWIGGGSIGVLRSMLPKSVTSPIAIELSRGIRGDPPLTAVFTVLAGLVGSIIGPWLLRRCRVHDDIAIGLAMGASAHGIGTARVVQTNDLQGGASGLAMALTGIITSLLFIPLRWWLG